MNFENFTSIDMEKVKSLGHHFVTTKYAELASVDWKYGLATGAESFLTLTKKQKMTLLGSCLLGSWFIYVSSYSPSHRIP